MNERLDRGGEETVLTGGIANTGAVMRVGDTVRRPSGPHTATVHAFLRHLRDVGFEGAPEPHGLDDTGREILDFVPGDVALPPFPEWAWSDDALISAAELTRRFHDAAGSFVPSPDAVWGFEPPPGWDGRFVGHNDLCRENVIFRDGAAVAFIDFDFAGPADRIFDVSTTAYYWMPLSAPQDLDVEIDQAARLRLFADAYELPRAERQRFVEGLGAHHAWTEGVVRARISAGEPGFVEMARTGWAERHERATQWHEANCARLERTLF